MRILSPAGTARESVLSKSSFLRWCYPSIHSEKRWMEMRNPHFVIPSEAEGPAVRLDAKQQALRSEPRKS